MVQVGLALLVSDEVHNAIRMIQLRLADACGTNPALRLTPHITLKQPFHAKTLAHVEAYFDELAPTVALDDIHLRGIGFFEDPDEGVAFVDLAPSPPLEHLRQRIITDLATRFGVSPREIEGERYHFHATLAYHLSAEQLAQARTALDGLQIDLPFTPERIALFYYTGDLWIVYKVARLGARVPPPPPDVGVPPPQLPPQVPPPPTVGGGG